jgi:hypothetical protein
MSTRTVYIKTSLVGGSNTAVDGIDGDDLLDGDVCHAFVSDIFYAYLLDDDSGAAESSPDIISPDANAGDKRWILQNIYGLAGKAASGANADITSMTGLDDGGIPASKIDGIFSGIEWSVVTSATNAEANHGYMCDTETTAAFTLTLPAAPSVGDLVYFADCTGYFATANLTIGRNGLKIMGLEEDMVVSVNNVSSGLVYSGATYGWRLC